MWVLTIEDEQGARTQVNLVRDVYSVGRDPTCTICLLDRNVSRLHAELRARPDGGWELVDLSSRYGSSVNGLRVRARAALVSGDAVQIGGYSFSLLDESAVLDGGLAPAPGKPDRLVVLEGAGAGRELRLDRGPVTIGGGTGCHLTLSDPALRFVVRPLEGRRYELVNVGPRAEVSINFGPVWRKLLEDEDLIEVPGEITLRFLRGDRAGSAEAGARSSAPPSASGGERPTWPAASPHLPGGDRPTWPAASTRLPGGDRPTWPTASTRLPGGEWPAAAAAISPPSDRPSLPPSLRPSVPPSYRPTLPPPSLRPSVPPSLRPSVPPSLRPSVPPSLRPSLTPPGLPSSVPPSLRPSLTPPSVPPSVPPSFRPSLTPPSARPALLPPSVPPSSGDRPSLPAFGPPSAPSRAARTPAGGTPARASGTRRHAANTLDGQVKALGDALSDSASMPISLSRLPASQGAPGDDAFHYPTAASVSLSVVPPARRRAASRLALPATMLLAAMGAGASLARHFSGPQAPAAAARAVEGRTAQVGSAVALSLGAPAASASASVKPAPSAAPSGLAPAPR